MVGSRRSDAFRGVLPVGVLDTAENRGRLLAALGVRVSRPRTLLPRIAGIAFPLCYTFFGSRRVQYTY
jgi:hypothetical protein